VKLVSALSFLILLFVAIVRADDDLPKQANFDRYQKILDHSPLAIATAAATAPDFEMSLYVANAAKTPEGLLVTIMSSQDKSLKEYVMFSGPSAHGYRIEWPDISGTKDK